MPKVKVEMVVDGEIAQNIVEILSESAFPEILEMENIHHPG